MISIPQLPLVDEMIMKTRCRNTKYGICSSYCAFLKECREHAQKIKLIVRKQAHECIPEVSGRWDELGQSENGVIIRAHKNIEEAFK